MQCDASRIFVVTGGPGAGKTTLLAALAARGMPTAPEAGRAIIRMQTAIGGHALPWRDRAAFAELMLSWDMRSREAALAAGTTHFLDRGIPDTVGFLRLCGLAVPGHVMEAARSLRYARTVFVLPPWRAIFSQDTERRQDWREAMRTHDEMCRVYAELGYDLAALPQESVEQRVDLVLDTVGRGRALPQPGGNREPPRRYSGLPRDGA